jgi:hypothetical protein
MSKPHPKNEAYFDAIHPQLFAPWGRYLMGLAELFGAHLCGTLNEVKDHNFVGDKCADCGTQRKHFNCLTD